MGLEGDDPSDAQVEHPFVLEHVVHLFVLEQYDGDSRCGTGDTVCTSSIMVSSMSSMFWAGSALATACILTDLSKSHHAHARSARARRDKGAGSAPGRLTIYPQTANLWLWCKA